MKIAKTWFQYGYFVNLNCVKNQRTYKISPFRVTTVLYHLWKIRCWIARATSTQYLKTNRFATFPMHTNERFFIPGKRILEGKLKARSVLLWNFNQVTEYTLFVVIGSTNIFIVYYIKLFLNFCVSLYSKLYINYLLILYGLIFILSCSFYFFIQQDHARVMQQRKTFFIYLSCRCCILFIVKLCVQRHS